MLAKTGTSGRKCPSGMICCYRPGMRRTSLSLFRMSIRMLKSTVVFANSHPEVRMLPLNMGADVERMYRHVMAGAENNG